MDYFKEKQRKLYAISLSVKSPLNSLEIFFLAVLFVMAGTYLCFIEVSVAFLNMIKKDKKRYYTLKYFTSISGLIYRLKQSATGLANICILSTIILVLVSSAVSFYLGSKNVAKQSSPRDIVINSDAFNEDIRKNIKTTVENELDSYNLKEENSFSYRYIFYIDKFEIENEKILSNSEQIEKYFTVKRGYYKVRIIPLEDVKEYVPYNLKQKEVYIYTQSKRINGDSIKLFGEEYAVKGIEEKKDIFLNDNIMESIHIIVSDSHELENLLTKLQSAGKADAEIEYSMGFDLKAPKDTQINIYKDLDLKFDKSIKIRSAKDGEQFFTEVYGVVFFCGILLGTVFMVAVVLIIYYKQIIEGYENRNRFSIMKKIGMSGTQIKESIRFQILMVFLLPLLFAGLHLVFAFPSLSKIMTLLNMSNTILFLKIYLVTYIVFSIIYVSIYAVTTRAYQKVAGVYK